MARKRVDGLTEMLEDVRNTSGSDALAKIRSRIEALAQELVLPLV